MAQLQLVSRICKVHYVSEVTQKANKWKIAQLKCRITTQLDPRTRYVQHGQPTSPTAGSRLLLSTSIQFVLANPWMSSHYVFGLAHVLTEPDFLLDPVFYRPILCYTTTALLPFGRLFPLEAAGGAHVVSSTGSSTFRVWEGGLRFQTLFVALSSFWVTGSDFCLSETRNPFSVYISGSLRSGRADWLLIGRL